MPKMKSGHLQQGKAKFGIQAPMSSVQGLWRGCSYSCVHGGVAPFLHKRCKPAFISSSVKLLVLMAGACVASVHQVGCATEESRQC